jgi:2-methylcitrate dehydratase PrpD
MPLEEALAELLDWLAETALLAEPEVEERMRLLLLDTLGCALSGLATEEGQAAAVALARTDAGAIRLPGVAAPLSASAASFLLALTACRDEACEGYAPAHGRPGLHAIPPALALGLAERRPLGDVLRAALIGYEVGARLGTALRIRPGMHVDGTWGLVAATASAGAMLGLERAALQGALAAAVCQMPCSLYRPVVAGSLARNTYAGHGAAMGVMLAAAALAGHGGPGGALAESARLNFTGAPLRGLDPPGRMLVLDGYLKRFAGVKHAHYPALAALELRAAPGFALEAVTAIEIATYSEAITHCNRRDPKAPIEAQFSMSWATAWALAKGELGPLAYREAALADAEVRRLERLVRVEEDAELTGRVQRGARVRLALGGNTIEAHADRVPGDPDAPLTAAEIEAKFLALAAPLLDGAEARRIARHILSAALTESALPRSRLTRTRRPRRRDPAETSAS